MVTDKLLNMGELSAKQRAFVDVFDGDGTAAVLAAGYNYRNNAAACAGANKLLHNPKIQRALAEKLARTNTEFDKVRAEHKQRVREITAIKKEMADMDVEILRGHIATKRERQIFWTNTMMDKKESIGDRLRASELLGKAEKDFVDVKELGIKGNGFAIISTPEVKLMLEEITNVPLPVPPRQIPEVIKIVDPHNVIIDIEAELPETEEPEPEPTAVELITWITGIQNDKAGSA